MKLHDETALRCGAAKTTSGLGFRVEGLGFAGFSGFGNVREAWALNHSKPLWESHIGFEGSGNTFWTLSPKTTHKRDRRRQLAGSGLRMERSTLAGHHLPGAMKQGEYFGVDPGNKIYILSRYK